MKLSSKRKSLFLLLLTALVCVASFFAGVSLLQQPSTVSAATTATVYDIGELGAAKKEGASGSTVNLGTLPEAVTSSSAVGIKMNISLTTGPNKGIKIGAFRTESGNAWASGGQMVHLFSRYANDTWDYWLEICDPSNVDSIIARTGLGIGVADLGETRTIEGELSIILENSTLSVNFVREGTTYTVSTTTIASTWGQNFPTYADNSSYTTDTTLEPATITDIEDLTASSVSTGSGASAICSLGTDTIENVGVKFTYTPSGSGQVKLGIFKSAENNVWSGAGYIIWFSDISNQQFNLLGCVNGNSEESLNLINISIADELADGKAVFEISVTSTAAGYTLHIVVDGTEKVVYSSTASDIPLGKYFNIYNEGTATGVFSTTHTYDELVGVYDVSVINTGTTEIEGASADTTYIGGLGTDVANKGVTYKLATPAQSGVVKLGLFKAGGSNVWGGATDGYILQYNAGASTFQLCDGDNNALTNAVSVTAALEHTIEAYNVTRYNNGEADGYHKVAVKVDGTEILSYQSNAIAVGGEFNGYGDGTAYTVSTTNKVAFDVSVTVNGNGSVTGGTGVYEGDTATLTITPDVLHQIASVTVDGADVTANVTDGKLSIENVTEATAVVVTFTETEKPVEITYDEVQNSYDFYDLTGRSSTAATGGFLYDGTLSISENVSYKAKFTIPSEMYVAGNANGYLELGLFVDGEQGNKNSGYVLNIIPRETAGTVLFQVQARTTANGTAYPYNNYLTLANATEFTVEAAIVNRYEDGVAAGHKLLIYVDGEKVVEVESVDYTVGVMGTRVYAYNTSSALAATAGTTTDIQTVDIDVTVSGNGSVTDYTGVILGSTATLTITAGEGSKLNSVTVDGVDVTASVVDGKLSIENVTEETTVVVEFISLLSYDAIGDGDIVDIAEICGQASVEGKLGAISKFGTVANGANKQITYKLVPNGTSGFIKLGFFKSDINNAWGGATDGYLLQYNVEKSSFQLCNGDNVSVTEEVTVTAAEEYTIAVYNVARYNDGAADGYHKLVVLVNGEELFSYEAKDIVLGNAFNGWGDGAAYTIVTTKPVFELDIEQTGEGVVEGGEVVKGFASTLTFIPADGYYLKSVTVDGVDVTDSLTGFTSDNGTYYEYILEEATESTKVTAEFAEATYVYESVVAADIADVTGVTSVFGGDKHVWLAQLGANSNVGMKFMLNTHGSTGIYKIGLMNTSKESVWNDGYVLKVTKTESGVYVQLIDALNDYNGAYVSNYADEIEVNGEYVSIEFTVEARTLRGEAAGHRIRVWVNGVEALAYETDLIALGEYFSVYNEAGGIFELSTAKEYEEVEVLTQGAGTVLGGKLVEGYATALAVIPESGYYVATFKWNLQNVAGSEGYTVKEGFYEYIASQPSKNDVAEIEFIEAMTKEATVYDMYDFSNTLSLVWGDDSAEIAASGIFMQTPVTGNDAIWLKIKLCDDFSGRLKLGVFKGYTAGTIWEQGGFIFEIRNMGDDKAIYLQGVNGGESTVGKYPSEVWTKGGAEFIVELGVVEYLGNGEHIGNYYYIKIDGTEILSYVDYTCAPYGPRMMLPYLENASATFTLSNASEYFTVTGNEAEGLVQAADYLVKAGETAEISIPLVTGYDVVLATANGVDVTALLEKVGGGYIYRVENVAEDILLEIVTVKAACKVEIENAEHLEITADKTAVDYNGSVVFTVVPEVGYVVSGATLGGVDVTDKLVYANGAYTYTAFAVSEDVTFTATAEAKTYNVMVHAGDGGKAEVSKAEVGAFGETVLTVTVNEGYQIASATVNGEAISVDAEGKYILACVAEDLSIEVSFEKVKAIPDEKAPVQPNGDEGNGSLLGGCNSIAYGMAATPLFAMAVIVLLKKKDQEENV